MLLFWIYYHGQVTHGDLRPQVNLNMELLDDRLFVHIFQTAGDSIVPPPYLLRCSGGIRYLGSL